MNIKQYLKPPPTYVMVLYIIEYIYIVASLSFWFSFLGLDILFVYVRIHCFLCVKRLWGLGLCSHETLVPYAVRSLGSLKRSEQFVLKSRQPFLFLNMQQHEQHQQRQQRQQQQQRRQQQHDKSQFGDSGRVNLPVSLKQISVISLAGPTVSVEQIYVQCFLLQNCHILI